MEEEEDVFEVEEVLDHKIVRGKDFYYIHWKGFDHPEDNTWEPIENVENCLDLVVAYYLKKDEKIPKHITLLLDEFKANDEDSNHSMKLSATENSENSNDLENMQTDHQNELEQEIENSEKDNDQELVLSSVSENDSNSNANSNLINEKNDSTDQQNKLSPNNIPRSSLSITIRDRKSHSYQENEQSNYDSDILENSELSDNSSMDFYSNDTIETEEEAKETSKLKSARSLWEIYGNSFKIKPHESTNKKDLTNNQDNIVELDVAQICGKRILNSETEYLVEFDGIADRYCWINQKDLNCDKEVRKFERKKKKNATKMSFDFFCHKYDNKIPHPPPEEIARAHRNVINLRKELLGTDFHSKSEVPSKKKNMLKLVKIYEQSIE